MATKKCKYCMTEIDKKAKVCPNCKRAQKSHGCLIAILIPLVIIAVVLVVILSTIDKSDNNKKASTSNDSNVSEDMLDSPKSNDSKSDEDDKIYNIGDKITIHNFELTVNSVSVEEKIYDDSGYMSYSPEDGSKYIVVKVDVKNVDTDIQTFLPSINTRKDISTKIKYQDYDFVSTNFLGVPRDDLHNNSLNPLSSTSGIIAFEVADEIVEKLDELELVFFTNDESCTFSLK